MFESPVPLMLTNRVMSKHLLLLSTSYTNNDNNGVFHNNAYDPFFQFHGYIMISHSASVFTLLYSSLRTKPFSLSWLSLTGYDWLSHFQTRFDVANSRVHQPSAVRYTRIRRVAVVVSHPVGHSRMAFYSDNLLCL